MQSTKFQNHTINYSLQTFTIFFKKIATFKKFFLSKTSTILSPTHRNTKIVTMSEFKRLKTPVFHANVKRTPPSQKLSWRRGIRFHTLYACSLILLFPREKSRKVNSFSKCVLNNETLKNL